tara:strand:- start:708 stop:1307 length:600 start_codon:yes stop_codon:yes gene_type:complete
MNEVFKQIRDAKPKQENGENLFVIENLPETPTEDINMLFAVLIFTGIHLNDAGIRFPIRAFTSYVDIPPTSENLEANLFTLKGINKVIGEEVEKFNSDKVFIKTQLMYEIGDDLPTIRLAFVDFCEDGDVNLITEAMLYPFIYPKYEMNFFSEERIEQLTLNELDIEFLQYLPNSRILEIKKDSNNELIPIKFEELMRL